MAGEGWSGIDVQLKRRADLVPALVEAVRGYARHESSVLEQVTELRGKVQRMGGDEVRKRGAAEGELSVALGKLIALAEAYPDLRADRNFLELQDSLATVEDEIQMARRYYNGATRNLNVAVESFPSNLVAELFGFAKRDFFEIDESDRLVPAVDFKGEGEGA
jgi:LemA protein